MSPREMIEPFNAEHNIGNHERLLSDPFEESDIEWRVQRSGLSGASKGWVIVLPYVTSRAIQQRLDDVFGVFGWSNEFKEASGGNGYLCGISIKSGDEWITKWDGAEATAIEPLKGALSGATKRAGVQLGIGRYLYGLKEEFAVCRPIANRFACSDEGTFIGIKVDKNNKHSEKLPHEWLRPELPEWALPRVEAEDLVAAVSVAEDLPSLRAAYHKAYNYASSFRRGDLLKQIIKGKDARKRHLEWKLEQEAAAAEGNLQAWLDAAINDGIVSAENESVLKLAKKRISDDLRVHGVDRGVDVADMMKVLDALYREQLQKLKAAYE